MPARPGGCYALDCSRYDLLLSWLSSRWSTKFPIDVGLGHVVLGRGPSADVVGLSLSLPLDDDAAAPRMADRGFSPSRAVGVLGAVAAS